MVLGVVLGVVFGGGIGGRCLMEGIDCTFLISALGVLLSPLRGVVSLVHPLGAETLAIK